VAKRKSSRNSSSSSKKQSRPSAKSDSNNRLGSILMLIVLLVLSAYYAITGQDPFGMFQPTPTPVVVSGGNWWQVYFTDPALINDPNNLAGSIPEKLIEQINSARQSIHIAAFEFNLTPIAEALIAAHRRGVEVQWVTDDEFGLEADGDEDHGQFAMLAAAGIEVKDDGRGALMHNKFLIFDGQVVWTGSTNLTRNDNFRNNNNVIVIRSSRVAEMYEREFAEMWAGGFGPRSSSTVDEQTTTIDATPLQILFAAEDEAMDHLVPLVESAQQSIRFMAFSFTNDALGAAVRERAAAGVDVQGIFELRGSETEFSQMRPLFCGGIPVRQDSNPGTFHHKVIVIDGQTVITGSLNFSDNANDSNDENVVVVTNPTIAALYLNEFERRWPEAYAPDTPLNLLPLSFAAEVQSLGIQRLNC
jgi:phosphatidylserine/phosphatidylglycerophosphate/cardiolipin synthase-like enzyme